MARIIEVTCPACGEVFEVEVPKRAGTPRGALAGIALADMDMDQLKREKINAKSVLYKAQKRNAPEETIALNQARVDAVEAEIAARKAAMADAEPEPCVEGGDEVEADSVYAEEI